MEPFTYKRGPGRPRTRPEKVKRPGPGRPRTFEKDQEPTIQDIYNKMEFEFELPAYYGFKELMKEFEYNLYKSAMELCKGKIMYVCKIFDVAHNTAKEKMIEYGIKFDDELL